MDVLPGLEGDIDILDYEEVDCEEEDYGDEEDDGDDDSFVSCQSDIMQEDVIPQEIGISYIEMLFDPERGGFIDIAENIVQYLDYHSLINFKRSCQKIHNFFMQLSYLEYDKLGRKLDLDWRSGEPKNYDIQAPGLVSCATVFPDNRRIIIGIDHVVRVVDIRTGEPIHILKHNEMNEYSSPITCVAYLDGFDAVASGSSRGDLCLWSLEEESTLISSKHLFGRLEALKWNKNNKCLVSAHFGCAYDIGCVTIRQFNSLTDISVIFSLYQEIFPVFCIDVCDNYMSTVEWSGTFNQVHTGTVNVYKWLESEPIANLTQAANTTFTCCRFIKNNGLLTGGQDGVIRVWQIKNDTVICQRELIGHKNIIMRMEIGWNCDRAVTRDINGLIFVWDLVGACNVIGYRNSIISQQENKNIFDVESYLVRKITSTSKTVTCIALDDRQLVMGSIGHLNVFDYWNSAP